MTSYFDRPDNTKWIDRAACRSKDIDPEWFFPSQDNGPSLSRARGICARCFVQTDCLRYALAAEGNASAKSRGGVYAGTTGTERYELYRRAQTRNRGAAA